MARTQAERKRITEACRDYEPNGSEDLVRGYLEMVPDYVKWSAGHSLPGFHRHHIFGRGNGSKNALCNLIGLHSADHEYGHQHAPKVLELCCLMAQFTLSIEQMIENTRTDASRLIPIEERYWSYSILNKICGATTIANRIEVSLLPLVVGTELENPARNFFECL